MLVLHHEVVEAVDLVHQQGNLGALVLEVHVLAHAGAQLLGLAHVDDLAGLVLPQVHARQRGHAVELALDAFELGALAGFGARGVGVVLARGAVERGTAAALALEALVVAQAPRVERGVARQALHAARVGRAEAVVGAERAGAVEVVDVVVEIVHAVSIANRTSVPLSAPPLHAVCKRKRVVHGAAVASDTHLGCLACRGEQSTGHGIDRFLHKNRRRAKPPGATMRARRFASWKPPGQRSENFRNMRDALKPNFVGSAKSLRVRTSPVFVQKSA